MTFSEGRTHTLTEISRLSGLPLSTAHRLTIEMLSWRLLARDPDGGYTIAMPLRLMDIAKRSPDLRDVAGATMDDLSRATGASTRVGLLGNRNVVYIEKFRVDGPVSDFSPAATLPAHATAIGKILLAFSPSRRRRRWTRFSPTCCLATPHVPV
jgi:DNA-binding IclR family transcriptional regulator